MSAGTRDDAARTARLNGIATARGQRVPPKPVRVAQRVVMKLGRSPAWAHPGVSGPSRVLIRVDEFPHYEALDKPGVYGTDGFERFHAILADAGVPYLIAALPTVAERPLDPAATGRRDLDDAEKTTLARLPGEGVTVALHGYDHRTRFAGPRQHSELSGLAPDVLDARLAAGETVLTDLGIPRPRVFVAPYNRFDADQWDRLAARYDVIGGGPEGILEHGFWRSPSWRSGAVYLPAYAPYYGTAAEVGAALDAAPGGWLPVVLHWGWEADRGWTDLERLVQRLAPVAAHWDTFLDAVEASR